MKKLLKIIIGSLGALILVVVLALVALITFVSPNHLKPLLTEQVYKATGRQLKIDGDLSWTIFPYLGVKIGHLELSNPSEFKQKTFAEIQGATIGVKLLPLLHAKIESSGMTLNGLKINLIKLADGKTNWQDLQKKPSSEPATPSKPDKHASAQKAVFGLAISNLDISDAAISWVDEQAKQNINIENFDLHAKDISLAKSFPFDASFNFAGTNPKISGKVALATRISINLEKQIYAQDNMEFTASIRQGAKNFDINLRGNIVTDMTRQTLQLDNLIAQIANLKASGKVNVTNLSSNPRTTGRLHIQPFDVKKWLQATGQDVDALQTLKNLSGDFDFTAGTTLPSVNLQGNVKVDEVQASKVKVSDIRVKTQMQDGVLVLAPLTAAFYQGNLQGQAKVNLKTAAPQVAVQAKLANFQAEPLMIDLSAQNKFKVTGAGNVDLQVTTVGGAGDAAVRNLNGTAHVSFNNGMVKGIDVGYLLESAYALVKKQSVSGSDSGQTAFGSLTANAVIRNGVVTNNDLYLDSSHFDTKGNGTINLVNQQINYHLETLAKQKEGNTKNDIGHLYGLPIPVLISGSLNSPNIQLDTEVLMKAIAKQQIQKAKEQIQDKVKEQLKDKVPAEAVDMLNNLLGH